VSARPSRAASAGSAGGQLPERSQDRTALLRGQHGGFRGNHGERRVRQPGGGQPGRGPAVPAQLRAAAVQHRRPHIGQRLAGIGQLWRAGLTGPGQLAGSGADKWRPARPAAGADERLASPVAGLARSVTKDSRLGHSGALYLYIRNG